MITKAWGISIYIVHSVCNLNVISGRLKYHVYMYLLVIDHQKALEDELCSTVHQNCTRFHWNLLKLSQQCILRSLPTIVSLRQGYLLVAYQQHQSLLEIQLCSFNISISDVSTRRIYTWRIYTCIDHTHNPSSVVFQLHKISHSYNLTLELNQIP